LFDKDVLPSDDKLIENEFGHAVNPFKEITFATSG